MTCNSEIKCSNRVWLSAPVCFVQLDASPLPLRPALHRPPLLGGATPGWASGWPHPPSGTPRLCGGSDLGNLPGEMLPELWHASWAPLKGRLGQASLRQLGCQGSGMPVVLSPPKRLSFSFSSALGTVSLEVEPQSALAASCLQLKTWGDPLSLPHLLQWGSKGPGPAFAPQWINSNCVLCPQSELLGFLVTVMAFLPAVAVKRLNVLHWNDFIWPPGPDSIVGVNSPGLTGK